MRSILRLLVVVATMACSIAAARAEAPTPGPRYVYVVWSCTSSSGGAWRCYPPPGGEQRYDSLEACQAVRARFQPRSLTGGAQWWQCWRAPAWEPAEDPPMSSR